MPFTAFGLEGPPASNSHWGWHVGRYNAVSSMKVCAHTRAAGRGLAS